MDFAAVRDTFAELVAAYQVPDAQLAIQHNGRSHTVESGPVAAPGTKFPVGSITKSFTAATVLALADDGDVELDSPVQEYLPHMPFKGITVRQLLSHTSGLPSASDLDETVRNRQEYVRRSGEVDLVHGPGKGFSYSNMGFAVAGHVVERVTGMTWWEAVDSIVLNPLGIEPSYVVSAGGTAAGVPAVPGHAVTQDRVFEVDQSLPVVLAPAGALACSAADLALFGLSELAEPMCRPVTADTFGMADGWGLGMALLRHHDTEWWGHDGTGDGTSCHLRVDPANGTAVALTTNAGTGLGMWDELVVRLCALGFPVGNHPYGTLTDPGRPIAPPAECLGTFRNGATEYSIESGTDGALYYAVDGKPHSRLTLYEDLVFSMQDLMSDKLTYTGRFERDPATGRIEAIRVSGRLARRINQERVGD